MINDDYQVKMNITVDNGQAISLKPTAWVASIFWKGITLSLFGMKKGDAVAWSFLDYDSLAQDKCVNPDYGKTEGLKKRIRLPANMVIDFKEALGCYEHGYYNASVVMSRRLLGRTLLAKGGKSRQRICDMVNDLSNRHIIDHRLITLSNDIKCLGNVGAHANEEKTNKADSEQALHFTDFLISWIFGEVKECE